MSDFFICKPDNCELEKKSLQLSWEGCITVGMILKEVKLVCKQKARLVFLQPSDA